MPGFPIDGHGHAEWIKTRNLMGFLIHAFELKLLHFNVFPCLYREAMHLQCFTPTLYVMGVATRTYKRDDHYLIGTKLHYGCLLALCGPTMHVATLCGVFRTFFFAYCVSHGCLKKKKNEK